MVWTRCGFGCRCCFVSSEPRTTTPCLSPSTYGGGKCIPLCYTILVVSFHTASTCVSTLRYAGWWDQHPAHLQPPTDEELGREVVGYVGSMTWAFLCGCCRRWDSACRLCTRPLAGNTWQSMPWQGLSVGSVFFFEWRPDVTGRTDRSQRWHGSHLWLHLQGVLFHRECPFCRYVFGDYTLRSMHRYFSSCPQRRQLLYMVAVVALDVLDTRCRVAGR